MCLKHGHLSRVEFALEISVLKDIKINYSVKEHVVVKTYSAIGSSINDVIHFDTFSP